MKVSRKRMMAVSMIVMVCMAMILFIYIVLQSLRAAAILSVYTAGPRPGGCSVLYPLSGTVFPPEIPSPLFQWSDERQAYGEWLVSIRFGDDRRVNIFTHCKEWRPSSAQWDLIKKRSLEKKTVVTIIGIHHHAFSRISSSAELTFSTSKDPVGDPLFYREVTLPFGDAVKDPSRIRWRFGSIGTGRHPPIVLEHLPVCGNCHSFSSDGKTIGMDVDYANDKGSYALTGVEKKITLATSDIISWSDYKKDTTLPTFGLLSQVSPDGRFVISTVRDRSVFVAKPDLAFSQLFFPIQGVLALYDRGAGTFSVLPGADDTALVQTNASWSPDGTFIVFARSTVYHLKIRDKTRALLSPEECSEFLDNKRLFRFDLYRIPFNAGKGGKAQPLAGASDNGMSNFFARYSPNGRWIVFCKASSFMLLQPDSKLYIMPAAGGQPRLMRCNTALMNSWHSWSSNSRWLVFSSKTGSPYTRLFITHVDDRGIDAPPVLLEYLTSPDRAANIPEFVNASPAAIETIYPRFIDDVSLWRSGKAFQDAGDLENAGKKFAEALEINPANLKAHISLGNILQWRGNSEGAFAHYSKALSIDSLSAIAHINAGNIFHKKEKYPEAIAHYLKALRSEPDNADAHYNLAQTCFSSGRFPDALFHYQIALRLRPDFYLAYFGLGKTYSKLGRNSDAVAQIRKGTVLVPDDPDAHHRLATALAATGRLKDAVLQYQEAVRLDPENPQWRFYMANILLKVNKSQAAQRYREALKIKPDFQEARDSLQRIEARSSPSLSY